LLIVSCSENNSTGPEVNDWEKADSLANEAFNKLNNDYFYKERKIIFIYPQYISYKGALDLDIDAIIELKYGLQLLTTNKCNIKFMLSQKIPIKYKKIHHIAGEEVSSNKNLHSGTKVSLHLNYFF